MKALFTRSAGQVVVQENTWSVEDPRKVVVILHEGPPSNVALEPDEARRLAVLLIESAAAAGVPAAPEWPYDDVSSQRGGEIE